MDKLEKTLYTARVHTTGGRDGNAKSDDGKLEVRLTPPATNGPGTNPEQLFAAGYSACYIGALKAVAGKMKVALPADLAVDAEVDLGPIRAGAAYGIAVRMTISLPGMDRAQAQQIVDAAHQVCPYSNATRGNVDVQLTLA
jgi:Ohr subfamily peroxiredoxin